MRVVASLGLAAILTASPAWGQTSTTIRVLLLTGGVDRDWRGESSGLRTILEATGRFEVRVSESPEGLTTRSLTGFDLVIDDYDGPTVGGGLETALAGFVASGKGLIVTRHGLANMPGSAPTGSLPVITKDPRSLGVDFLEIKWDRPDHPIARGMKPSFRSADSLLTGLVASPTGEVLASARDRSSGLDVPMLIASNSGTGRVVCLSMGRDLSTIHEPGFAVTLARAAEWAATGSVSLPPEPLLEKTRTGRLKGLVITGGHDHDAAFYDLFDGIKVFDRLPILTSADAFKADLRGQYHVIIMYDFTRELDESAKKNLRDYVEAGGGVVVLHHALLNFQSWDWWDNEVVGGSYRLSRSGTTPSSTVKDDQQIEVRLVGDHPVLAGLAPFKIQDEAYKGLRMSPNIHPLLTTDNPTSDLNLAWIGPREGAKVVAIQLGHGRTAFANPSYRRLIRNAIEWAGGKTK